MTSTLRCAECGGHLQAWGHIGEQHFSCDVCGRIDGPTREPRGEEVRCAFCLEVIGEEVLVDSEVRTLLAKHAKASPRCAREYARLADIGAGD